MAGGPGSPKTVGVVPTDGNSMEKISRRRKDRHVDEPDEEVQWNAVSLYRQDIRILPCFQRLLFTWAGCFHSIEIESPTDSLDHRSANLSNPCMTRSRSASGIRVSGSTSWFSQRA